MTQQSYITQWEPILEADDAERARALWRQALEEPNQGLPIRINLIAQTLEHRPLPTQVLDALLKSVHTPNEWLTAVASRSIGVDWSAFFDWYGQTRGQDALEREMFDTLRDGLVIHQNMKGRHQQLNVGRMELLNAILNRKPDFVHRVEDIPPEDWCALSMEPSGGTWLAKCGLNVDAIVYAGLQHQVQSLFMSAPKESAKVHEWLNGWLDRDPAFRQAWNGVMEKDEVRVAHHAQWVDTWVGQEWKESPLQRWCQAMVAGEPGALMANPRDHAVFQQAWPQMNAREEDLRQYAQELLTRMAWRNGQSLEEQVELVNRRKPSNEYVLDGRWILETPMAPTLYGFCSQHPWSKEAITSREGAGIIQQGLTQDARVRKGLSQWKMRDVLEWCLEEPSWKDWKDKAGRNVVGLFLHEMTVRTPDEKKRETLSKPSKSALMRVARLAPDLLIQPDNHGIRVLDLLTLAQADRAEVERLLLGQHVNHPRPRQAPRPRGM